MSAPDLSSQSLDELRQNLLQFRELATAYNRELKASSRDAARHYNGICSAYEAEIARRETP